MFPCVTLDSFSVEIFCNSPDLVSVIFTEYLSTWADPGGWSPSLTDKNSDVFTGLHVFPGIQMAIPMESKKCKD